MLSTIAVSRVRFRGLGVNPSKSSRYRIHFTSWTSTRCWPNCVPSGIKSTRQFLCLSGLRLDVESVGGVLRHGCRISNAGADRRGVRTSQKSNDVHGIGTPISLVRQQGQSVMHRPQIFHTQTVEVPLHRGDARVRGFLKGRRGFLRPGDSSGPMCAERCGS